MSYTYKQNEDVMNQKCRVRSKYFKSTDSPRKKVQAALNLFRELLSKRMREMKAESDFKSGATRAAYIEVAKDLQWERKWVNVDKRIKPIPGIEVGQGRNPRAGKSEPKDQKLERGNLALKNSMEAGTHVRVIRGIEGFEASKNRIYVYDGLYVVDKFTKERGEFGKLYSSLS
ncbi:hypothetical protein SO802_023146 [Lithocarpus litseifolius]|uniref:YDG domain-containing protein n=1 Tax=Lithocarpus litseifolius TaxID=425828 RepID=A0AAW2C668_9ROSI